MLKQRIEALYLAQQKVRSSRKCGDENLQNARHERNSEVMDFFFVTRKGRQLAVCVYLELKATRLQGVFDRSEDRLVSMSSRDAGYDDAVNVKRQNWKNYDEVDMQRREAWAKFFGREGSVK